MFQIRKHVDKESSQTKKMSVKRKDSEMVKCIAEELQIIIEKKLSKTLCTSEVLQEGREIYRKVMCEFLNVVKFEMEELVKKLHDFKVKGEEGLIKFCLEKPILAMKNIINLVENWILPFGNALGNGEEWSNNLRLMESLHVSVADKVCDLSRNELIENCMSYSERFFIRGRIEAAEVLTEKNSKSGKTRLSLKRKSKS